MALDADSIKFLVHAKKSGVDFASTAMIGRQSVFARPWMLRTLLAPAGIKPGQSEIRDLWGRGEGYAEALLRLFGARSVESFDYANYENATHIHDFNVPIPIKFHGQYNVVIDGGSLEHVFNFPVAMRNCMEMVTVGGHFVGIMPCNNQPGHGFYQFSPELVWRIFSYENGFKVRRLVLREVRHGAPWFEIVDPAAVKRRVTFVNKRPALMLVLARKERQVEVFRSAPQQSDYVAMWQRRDLTSSTPYRVPAVGRMIDCLPYAVVETLWLLRQMLRRRRTRLDPDCFHRCDPHNIDG